MEFKLNRSEKTWEEAQIWIESLGPGWRLPTIKEIESAIKTGVISPVNGLVWSIERTGQTAQKYNFLINNEVVHNKDNDYMTGVYAMCDQPSCECPSKSDDECKICKGTFPDVKETKMSDCSCPDKSPETCLACLEVFPNVEVDPWEDIGVYAITPDDFRISERFMGSCRLAQLPK